MPDKVPNTGGLKNLNDFKNFTKQNKQKLVESGQILNTEKLEGIRGGTPDQSTSYFSTYETRGKEDVEDFEDYIDPNIVRGGEYSFEDLRKLRAENQSNWEQAGHGLERLAVNVIPQILAGTSSMLDIPGYFDAEHAASNDIVNWANDLKERTNEQFSIHRENPNKPLDFGDFAWWAENGEGLAESVVSFMAQGAIAGKVLGGVSKFAKAVSGGKTFKGATGLNKIAAATMLNQSEAVMEASSVYKDINQHWLEQGYSADYAKKQAAIGASTTMNLNRINILLNLSSAGNFLKTPSLTRQLLTNPTIKHTLTELGKEGSQEAVEELINHVASQAGMAHGKGQGYTKDNAFQDIKSAQGLEAAFLGAIGGIAQTGGQGVNDRLSFGTTSVIDADNNKRISKIESLKRQYTKQQEIINELKDKGVKYTDVLNTFAENQVFEEKLANAKTPEEQESLQKQFFEHTAIKHFQAGTTEVLENVLKAEAEKDPEEVGQERIDRAKQALKELKTLEDVYINSEKHPNVDEIFYNRANKIRAERTLAYAEDQHKKSEFELIKAVDEIAKKHSFEQERQVLIKKDGVVVDTETKTEKVPLRYSISDIDNNAGDTDANKASYDKFLEEVHALDAYKARESAQESVSKVKQQLYGKNGIEERYKEITSTKHQTKYLTRKEEQAKIEQFNKDLLKTTSISEIEKMKEATTDEDFHKAADAKIEEIKKSNDAQAKQKKTQATVAELNTRIEKATEEELEGLLEEINNAELSQTHKTNLRNAYDRRAGILNGTPVAVSPEEENPLGAFGFTNNNPNDTAEEIKREEESRATNLPKDLPNPKTETKDVEQQVADTATKLLETDTTRVTGQDAQGNLTYAYGKSTEGHNSGAVLSREFTQTENGGIVTREESTDDIENLQVLDPEVLQSGTPLIMEVDTDYIGPKYDPSSNTRETTSWVDRLAVLKAKAEQQGIPLTQLEEYIAEVPIKVTMEDGTTVFYVHDNAWFREENLDNTPDAIAQDKANNFKIREQIIKKGKVTTKVSYKSFGHLFRAYDGSKITTSEAMPDSDLVLSVCKNRETLDFTKGKLLPTTLQEGRTYAIVPVGPDTYLPVPLERAPITQEIVDSIMIAVEAHLSGDTENPVIQAIGNSNLGLDITTTEGLNKYVQQFIYLYPTEKQEGIENLLINQGGSKSTLSSSRPIIAITATGIEFGRPGVQMGSYTNQDGVKVQSFAITLSKNFKKDARTTKGLAALRAILESGNVLSHTRLENLQKNLDCVILLDNQGATRTIKYSQQVKDSTVTNLRSINIGTEEAPKYVYTIQPTIKFDVTFAKLGKAKKAKNTTKKKTTIPKVTVAPIATKTTTITTSTIEVKKVDIERRRQEERGESLERIGVDRIGFDGKQRVDWKDAKSQDLKQATNHVIERISKNPNTKIASLPSAYGNAIKAELEIHGIKTTDRTLLSEIINPLQEINAEYDAELAALEQTMEQVIASSPIPSIEQQVEEAVDLETIIEQEAIQMLADHTIEEINGFLDNINIGLITEEDLQGQSLEQVKQAINRAKEIHKKNSEKKTTFQFPGKKNITIDGNTKDSADISEDTFDYLISPLNEEQVEELNSEVEAMIIRGVDSETQRSLIAYISAEIIQKTLEEKEVGGARTVKVKDIMNTNKAYFTALAEYYRENGLPNKAKRLEAVVEQFDKVDKLVQQYMNLLTTGTVTSKPKTDSEESVGLEKTLYTDDWAFTIDSKSTASGDLKKFFANIQAQDKDGLKQNSLGLEEIMPFDAVYDTLHEILANKPADYTTMMEVLKLYAENFPWINSVVESIEKAPERIKNEFVSDMAKHHIEMSFVMWERNKNGTYNLQRWSSNSASKENRLRAMWQSNLRGVGTSSNIVVVNDEDEYVFDHVVVDRLITQAEKFAEDPSVVTNDDIANWLGQLGIVLADDTYDDLRNGLFNNKGKKTFNQLFTHSQGLFKVLTAKLKTISNGRPKPGKPNTNLVDNANLMTDSVVKALAKLDATNSLNTSSNSFQSGGKTVYSYGNNNYLVNRMRDLTAHNGEKFINEELIKHLQETSFTKDSLWLKDITSTDALGEAARRQLGLDYLSLEALKKRFTPSQDDRKLNNLTPAEHEVIKLGLFLNNSGQIIGSETRRSVQFFYPTMSDKTTMLSITALARELTLEEGVISKGNIKLLFDALVQPEINRIRDKQASDIKGYEPNYFYFLPALNTELITINGKEKTVLDFVKDKDDSIYSQEFKDQVESKIREIYEQLVEDKLKDWKTLGIGKTVKDAKGKVTDQFMFLNSSYMADVAKGIGEAKVKYAAMDYIFNSLIANSEAFKLFAGDPALYAKFKKDKTLQQNLEETFINIGKRLAGDIAPGIELANSANNKYLQVFLEDKELNSNNVNDSVQLEYFSKIMKDYKKNYSGIEGSDAQEYTTWQEHIYVMKQLGRITDNQFEVFNRKLTAQTDKAAKGIPLSKADKLTYEELGLVMQPIKPVYVGNIAVTGDNVDRRIYIKSSSFPLIPELTAGLQIEKARKALEKFEAEIGSNISSDGNPAFVRASFGTANKVGAVKNAVKLFDDNGNVNDNIEIKEENSLVLNRSNFRIQQDVPYKREKNEINVGSQEMKLLFVNLLDVQVDENHTGEQLLASYNQAYKELYEYANEKLAERLGLVTETTSTPELASLLKTPTTTAVADVHVLKESLKGKSTVQNVIAKQKFSEEKGENTIDRVKFIDKNFDKIVASLLKDEQIKVLFQDENNQNKKCE